MSFVETKFTVVVFLARCDECGNAAGEPAMTKEKALAGATKRWGFVVRGDRLLCCDCGAKKPEGKARR
jgi:hypothetical protein